MKLNKYNNLLELFNFQFKQQNLKNIFLKSLKNGTNFFTWQETFDCMQKWNTQDVVSI